MSDYYMGVLIGATLVGIGMGLFPLIIGLMFKRNGLAIGGFIASVIGGFILGLIAALPISLGFTIYLAKQIRDERKVKIEGYDF